METLARGVAVWNRWRRRHKGSFIELDGADLTGADLAGADLSEVSLAKANLTRGQLAGCDLRNANLVQTNFRFSDLRGANLCKAKASCADFTGADLRWGLLSSTDLTEASLSNTRLSEADLKGALLNRACLAEADLAAAKLDSAELCEANLTHADLSRAILSMAGLERADLRKARLVNSQLFAARLMQSDLSEADLCGATLLFACLAGAKLCRATLCRANLTCAVLFSERLVGEGYIPPDLTEANLSEAKLSEAALQRVTLPGADFSGADLTWADLTGANLHGANLSKARLFRANLSHADLTGVRLDGADLSQVDLTGTKLHGVRINRKRIRSERQRAGALTRKEHSLRMIQASRRGAAAEVRTLVNQCGGLDLEDERGETALVAAADNGQADVVHILLEAGSRTETSNGETALVSAAAKGDAEIVKLLLDAGADPFGENFRTGETPLMVAESGGHLELAKLIRRRQSEICQEERTRWETGNEGMIEGSQGSLRRALWYADQGQYGEAKGFYAALWRENFDHRKDIFWVAACAPMLAAAAAYYLTQHLSQYQTLVAVLTLLFLGYLPPVLMRGNWVAKKKYQDLELPEGILSGAIIASLMFFLQEAGFLIAVAIYAAVLALPWYLLFGLYFHLTEGTPWFEPPYDMFHPVAIIFLVLGFLVALSDVDPWLLRRPRTAFPELAAGLWLSKDWNLSLLAGLAVGLVIVGTGPLGLIYEHPLQSLLASGLAGTLLGVDLSRHVRDDEISMLSWVGVARCDLRLGNLGTARWRLRLIRTEALPRRLAFVENLASSLVRLADPRTVGRLDRSIIGNLDRAAEGAAEAGDNRYAWLASVEDTRSLLRHRTNLAF